MDRLEKKLESLSKVHPDRGWVLELKGEIIEKPSLEFGEVWSRVYLAFSALALVFIFGFNYYNKNVRFPQVTSADFTELQKVSMDLRSAGQGLADAQEGIERIDRADEAVEIGQKVVETVQDAERVVEASRRMVTERQYGAPADALTMVSGVSYATEEVERATENLKEAYILRQKEVAESEIREIEEKSLNEEQKILFREAKELYDNGSFQEALLKVLEVQNY